MKIIHTSDIHLYSPLTSKLSATCARQRRHELLSGFARLTSRAREIGAAAVIIAGDLFDTSGIGKSEADAVISLFEKEPELTFLYLAGNHEKNALAESGLALPLNLVIFGEDWTYHKIGGVTFAGRSRTDRNMFDTLRLTESGRNIVILHGELRERSDEGGVIGTKDAAARGIDYLALGHYHKYSSTTIDERAVAVYSGTPEGRGFDEVGELGYSLIDISADGVEHRFVPFAKRLLIERDVDITAAERASDVERMIIDATADIDRSYLVRAKLVGKRGINLRYDTEYIKEALEQRFFYFEIKDKSTLSVNAEDFIYDKSLKGEFIRMVMADESLSERERAGVINLGLAALAGEDIGGDGA